jgi:hypothetical protein
MLQEKTEQWGADSSGGFAEVGAYPRGQYRDLRIGEKMNAPRC